MGDYEQILGFLSQSQLIDSASQVIAEHPTAEFDAKWGHGRVPAEAFVQEVYRDLTQKKEK